MKLDKIELKKEEILQKDEFLGNLESKLKIDICKNEILENNEWIDEILFTIPYLEKALRNPNKNIVTEEEVVKIELIKKVTVESIKHLSKHTDLISDYDKETGDVIPSKILNAFKEENFITYENRFIYTLIKLIEDFISVRKRKNEERINEKNHKNIEYEAITKIGEEKIKYQSLYKVMDLSRRANEEETQAKITKIEDGMKNLKSTDTYKLLDSKKVSLVKAPLKMTNVLLKNVNFQYAVKLYNYLSNNFGMKNKTKTIKNKYEENGKLKYYMDEIFYFEHFFFQKEEKNNIINREKNILDNETKKKITDRYITRILEINPELKEQDIKKMIAEKFIKLNKNKKISLKPIENIFKNKMNEYLIKVKKMRLK